MAELAPFRGVVHPSKDPERLIAPSDEGWAQDSAPVIYRIHHELPHDGRTLLRKSFVALMRLTPFSDGVVLPCRTPVAGKRDEGKKQTVLPLGLHVDRYHMVDKIFEELETTPPEAQGRTADGVVHRMWRLVDEAAIKRVCNSLGHDKIYLVAGQDRYESMLAHRDELAAGKPVPRDAGLDWAPMMFCNVDDEGLVLLPSHRVVSGLAAFERGDFLARCREFFTVSEGPLAGPHAVRPALHGQRKRGATLALLTPGSSKIAYLRLRGDLIKQSVPALAESRGLGDLDVTLLDGVVLQTLLEIDSVNMPKRVRYVSDWERAFAELETPGVQAVFLVNPTLIEQLCIVADEGRLMPIESATIHPPVTASLVVRALDPNEKVHAPS